MQSERWERLERTFAKALEIPPARRANWIAQTCADDAALRRDLVELLRAHETTGVLDAPALDTVQNDAAAIAPSLAADTCVGAWRIERLVGRGGMGEVYAVARADRQFAQRGALKLLRFEAIGELARFHAERQILARLDHPGIARLLDGGVAADGRPYTVMEFVEGVSLPEWCHARQSNLRERLDLFAQVCEAVAYAHRNLIVHRDLKPANTLVDADGKVKLLDFGIAKLLDASAPNALTATVAPFTLDYAAPEQLAGEAVTTATDVYALGALLFEMLTGERPLRTNGLPSTQALALLNHHSPPIPSQVARGTPGTPVPANLLAGDLDAIIAKCLRREPAHRYDTVNALLLDLQRHRAQQPVRAREGARLYVFGRMVRRYRWVVAATVILILALAAGLAGTLWQARRAESEARRANAVKQFLLGVFKASDPRIASDKPRGQITARELLDASATRIDKEFAAQPELQIELLGEVASILHALGEQERSHALYARQVQLARAHLDADSAVEIGGLLIQASDAVDRLDFAAAMQPLDRADAAIRRSGREHTALRAQWWLLRGHALIDRSDARTEREHALFEAVQTYSRYAPDDPSYATALNDYGNIFLERGDNGRAIEFYRRALQVDEHLPDRNDAEMQMIFGNLGQAYMQNGDFAAAQQALAKVADIAQRTYGENNAQYWFAASFQAQSACLSGDRDNALQQFTRLEKLLPDAAKIDYDAGLVREKFGYCLVSIGQPQKAIPRLQSALAAYQRKHQYPIEIPRISRTLGDAYAQVGRVEDARRALNEALAGLDHEAPSYALVLSVRERLGRFLLEQGELDAAQAQFQQVLAQAHERHLGSIAMAHAGLARLALARSDRDTAQRESAAALALWNQVSGFRDVRTGPYLQRIRADALAATGEFDAAQKLEDEAVAASARYDDPSSPTTQRRVLQTPDTH